MKLCALVLHGSDNIQLILLGGRVAKFSSGKEMYHHSE